MTQKQQNTVRPLAAYVSIRTGPRGSYASFYRFGKHVADFPATLNGYRLTDLRDLIKLCK